MKTVGEMLKEARTVKNYSLIDVEKATKIRLKFLEAIERDEYGKLPSISYAKGFVKNYSEFLGLNSRHILAFFRRQTEEVTRSSLLPKGIAAPLNPAFFRLTPGRFLAILVTSCISVFVLYFGWQYVRLNHPPTLVIDTPKNQQVFSQTRIDVLGKTDPDATVTINGTSVLVRSDGRFFDQLQLVPGVNKITVIAVSRFNKMASSTLEVGLQQ